VLVLPATIVSVPLCHNTGFVDQLGHALIVGGSIASDLGA